MAKTPLLLHATPIVTEGQTGSGESFSMDTVITYPESPDNKSDVYQFVDPIDRYALWSTIKGAPPVPVKDIEGNRSYEQTAQFYKWMRARGYSIGEYYVGSETAGVKVWNIYERTTTGQYRSVGKNSIIPEIFDSEFWAVAKLLASVVTAGGSDVIVAAGEASVNDNKAGYQNAAVSAVKSYAGAVDTGTTSTAMEVSTVDFNFDYTDTFGSFDYSSGEAFTAFSDSSNVDYGFGAYSPDFSATVADATGATLSDVADYSHEGSNWNATAESSTSDYGSSSMGNSGFDSADIKSLSSGVSVAAQVAKLGSSNNSVTSGSQPSGGNGSTKYSQTVNTLGGLLADGSKPSQGSAPITQGIGGLITQIENAVNRTYTGQLGPNKTAPSPSGSANTTLYIGAALIAVALIIHFKG